MNKTDISTAATTKTTTTTTTTITTAKEKKRIKQICIISATHLTIVEVGDELAVKVLLLGVVVEQLLALVHTRFLAVRQEEESGIK
jgi:hypothetical protein